MEDAAAERDAPAADRGRRPDARGGGGRDSSGRGEARLGNQTKEGEGQLVATLRKRKHVAVLAIPHDATHFDVTYRSSENLDCHEGRGTIHPNYNRWVNNLVFDISGMEAPGR